jgi:hypothetical protein
MSAVNRPNKNFDNETMVHTSYSEIVKGQLKSSYDKFRSPKSLPDKKKKVKKQVVIQKDPKSFKKWFR